MISLLWPKLMISLLWPFDQLTLIFGSKWLNFFASCTERKKMNHFDLKNWMNGGTKIWPKFLGQNDSIFPLSFTERKNEPFWPKKFNHWQNKNLTQIFKSKWLNFFASCTERKISHFDLKNWNTGRTKIWPKFLGQNDSIFLLTSPREKMSHFDLKSWVTDGKNLDPNF